MPSRSAAPSGALSLLLGQVWAIREEAGARLRDAAATCTEWPTPQALTQAYDTWLPDAEATIEDGIATIQVHGTLYSEFSWFTWLFGGSSYPQIAHAVEACVRNPDVTAIVLHGNTPGGQVIGADECARAIRAADAEKPVIWYAAGETCSSGMWLASGCREIVANPTAMLGSIGTAMTFIDTSRRMRREGFRQIDIISRQSPNKWPDITEAAGRAQFQTLLDDLAAVMLATIGEHRGLSAADVEQQYGAGAVFVGEVAVQAGLADRLGTWESLRADLREGASLSTPRPQEPDMPSATIRSGGSGARRRATAPATAATQATAAEDDEQPPDEEEEQQDEPAAEDTDGDGVDDDEEMDDEEDDAEEESPAARAAASWAAKHPRAAAHLRQDAAAAERERLAAIDALARPGTAKLIAKCKADPKCTPERAALALLRAESAARTKHLESRSETERDVRFPSNRASARDALGEEGDEADALAQSILTAGRAGKRATS